MTWGFNRYVADQDYARISWRLRAREPQDRLRVRQRQVHDEPARPLVRRKLLSSTRRARTASRSGSPALFTPRRQRPLGDRGRDPGPLAQRPREHDARRDGHRRGVPPRSRRPARRPRPGRRAGRPRGARGDRRPRAVPHAARHGRAHGGAPGARRPTVGRRASSRRSTPAGATSSRSRGADADQAFVLGSSGTAIRSTAPSRARSTRSSSASGVLENPARGSRASRSAACSAGWDLDPGSAPARRTPRRLSWSSTTRTRTRASSARSLPVRAPHAARSGRRSSCAPRSSEPSRRSRGPERLPRGVERARGPVVRLRAGRRRSPRRSA